MIAATRLALVVATAASLLFAAPAARAQAVPVPAPVIVTVDLQQILRDSRAAKDVQAQMTQRTDGYTKDVSAQESELQKIQDDLERQRNTLGPDEFNAKMRDFQQRYDALDNRVQTTRQALQQAYNDAMTKVENTALQIISDVAAEHKANVVISKAAVLFEAPGLDITQEVIGQLDTKLASLPLALPAEKGGAAAAAAPQGK